MRVLALLLLVAGCGAPVSDEIDALPGGELARPVVERRVTLTATPECGRVRLYGEFASPSADYTDLVFTGAWPAEFFAGPVPYDFRRRRAGYWIDILATPVMPLGAGAETLCALQDGTATCASAAFTITCE